MTIRQRWYMAYRRARSQKRRWGWVRVSADPWYGAFDVLAAQCVDVWAYDTAPQARASWWAGWQTRGLAGGE